MNTRRDWGDDIGDIVLAAGDGFFDTAERLVAAVAAGAEWIVVAVAAGWAAVQRLAGEARR